MTTLSSHIIRPATDRDANALHRLAELDEAPPLTGEVLVAERNGVPVAAMSLADGRTIADPFRLTGPERADLRARARALGTTVHARSLRSRIREAVAPRRLAAL